LLKIDTLLKPHYLIKLQNYPPSFVRFHLAVGCYFYTTPPCWHPSLEEGSWGLWWVVTAIPSIFREEGSWGVRWVVVAIPTPLLQRRGTPLGVGWFYNIKPPAR
jgi:hypothetical protein